MPNIHSTKLIRPEMHWVVGKDISQRTPRCNINVCLQHGGKEREI